MPEITSLIRKMAALAVIATVGVAGCGRVELVDPENGTFTEASTVTVSGNVFSLYPDDAPIDIAEMDLTINGSPIGINPDGSFSTNMLLDPGQIYNAIEANVYDNERGFADSDRVVVIVGESIADGAHSPEAIALQINSSGLNALEPVVSSLVDLDLPTLMPVGTVVADDLCVIDGIFGCMGRADITISAPEPTITGFDIDFTSQQDSVNALIALNGFDLNLYIDGGPYVLVPNCHLNLRASAVTLNGNFALEPDSAQPTKVDVAQIGNVSTNFVNFNQTFTSGACNTFLVGDIIQLIIGDVEPLVRNGIEDFLNSVDGNGNTAIASAVEGALAGVDISGPIGQALDAQLDAPFFQVQETAGGITLGSNASFVANIGTGPGQCEPPEAAPDLTASYHVTQPFPSFGTKAPGGERYDIGIGISSSGFNQLLRSMVECGLLVTTITEIDLFGTGSPIPLTTGLLANFFPELSTMPPNDPARIELAPTIAPLVTGEPGPAGELALLKIAQLNMKVILDVSNPAFTEPFELADLMLDADVGINLGFDSSSGSLVFELAEPDPTSISVHTVENPLGSDVSTVEALLPQIVSSVLPSLAGGLANFPVPSFLGLELDVVEVARNGEMLTIYADLAPGTP